MGKTIVKMVCKCELCGEVVRKDFSEWGNYFIEDFEGIAAKENIPLIDAGFKIARLLDDSCVPHRCSNLQRGRFRMTGVIIGEIKE